MRLHDKQTISEFDSQSWEGQAFQSFAAVVSNKETPFPCTLGVAGLAANQLRFHFVDHDPRSDAAARQVAAALQTFVTCARSFGKNTSLVVMFRESGDHGIEAYEATFWHLLSKLHQMDARPWPVDIPRDADQPRWEFSFAGEPIFVVCNSPSHKRRASRHSSHFMLTFQPRWVFDGVIGEGAPNSERIKLEIRRRLHEFDALPPSPDLGAFGDAENREWKQYFLGEDNNPRTESCPFHQSRPGGAPGVVKTSIHDLAEAVTDLLPPTGAVEVQMDTPFRWHPPHRHRSDETLHIIRGHIEFEVNGDKLSCGPGDRLLLPAETLHASRAGEDGCLYVIATRTVMPQGSAPCAKEGIRHDK